jgi:hypothetical protein
MIWFNEFALFETTSQEKKIPFRHMTDKQRIRSVFQLLFSIQKEIGVERRYLQIPVNRILVIQCYSNTYFAAKRDLNKTKLFINISHTNNRYDSYIQVLWSFQNQSWKARHYLWTPNNEITDRTVLFKYSVCYETISK